MSPPRDGQPSLNQLAQLFPVFFQPPPMCRSQRNVSFQDVVGTLGQSANEIGVSVGEDGSSQFVVFVSIQRLYTQDVSFHQFRHRANEDSNQRSAFLYLRQVDVLDGVVRKNGRT